MNISTIDELKELAAIYVETANHILKTIELLEAGSLGKTFQQKTKPLKKPIGLQASKGGKGHRHEYENYKSCKVQKGWPDPNEKGDFIVVDRAGVRHKFTKLEKAEKFIEQNIPRE